MILSPDRAEFGKRIAFLRPRETVPQEAVPCKPPKASACPGGSEAPAIMGAAGADRALEVRRCRMKRIRVAKTMTFANQIGGRLRVLRDAVPPYPRICRNRPARCTVEASWPGAASPFSSGSTFRASSLPSSTPH